VKLSPLDTCPVVILIKQQSEMIMLTSSGKDEEI
jgi:hypothetical protein